ncbi:MAG: class I SAM-dependent methyltransferase [Woeseia sp.]
MSIRSTAAFVILAAVAACRAGDGPDTESTIDKPAPAAESPEPASGLRTLLASEGRPETDRARDAGRRPADVINFLGIDEGMHVIDIIAAGGYYTEVLSLTVGDDGRVVAHNPPIVLEMRDGANEKAISARLAGNRLPNVTRLNKDFADFVPEDGPFDAAITALNFHDLYNRRGPEATVAVFQAVASVLKPGAILGIIDHVGEAGEDNVALHRIEISKVLETIEAAGLVIEADSDLLRNEADDHSLSVFDAAVRGKTDRFLLRVSRPAD